MVQAEVSGVCHSSVSFSVKLFNIRVLVSSHLSRSSWQRVIVTEYPVLLLGKNLDRRRFVIPSSMQLSGVFLLSNVVITALPAGRNSPRADFFVKRSHPGTCLKTSWRYSSAKLPRETSCWTKPKPR